MSRFTSARQGRCGRNFRLSRLHRFVPFTSREICYSASPHSFVWMVWSSIPACTASILAPDSYAGRIAAITRAERNRVSSGLKEVLVLGDSRMAEGFSTALADELALLDGFKFVNLTESASAVEHMGLHPARSRSFETHVTGRLWFPMASDMNQAAAEALRISMAAPLLRYGDCFRFASAFQTWSGRFRSVYRMHPARLGIPGRRCRFSSTSHCAYTKHSARAQRDCIPAISTKAGIMISSGTSYDPKTGQVTFPPRLTRLSEKPSKQPGAAIPIGNTTLPENAARWDPANLRSLFDQPNENCPCPHPTRSVCWRAGSFHYIPRRFPRCHDAEGCFFASRTNLQFSRETRILL